MNELTDSEKDLILDALAYLVEGGLTSFDLSLYKSVWNKLKRPTDRTFEEVLAIANSD